MSSGNVFCEYERSCKHKYQTPDKRQAYLMQLAHDCKSSSSRSDNSNHVDSDYNSNNINLIWLHSLHSQTMNGRDRNSNLQQLENKLFRLVLHHGYTT